MATLREKFLPPTGAALSLEVPLTILMYGFVVNPPLDIDLIIYFD